MKNIHFMCLSIDRSRREVFIPMEQVPSEPYNVVYNQARGQFMPVLLAESTAMDVMDWWWK